MIAKNQPPINLLVRLPISGKAIAEIVDLHNAIADLHGSVWFGVRGRAPSEERQAWLTSQANRGITTYLYLLQREKRQFIGFRAFLNKVVESMPESSLIPTYYNNSDLKESAVLWANVQRFRRIDGTTISSLRVVSTGSPLEEVLSRSMACVMLVS